MNSLYPFLLLTFAVLLQHTCGAEGGKLNREFSLKAGQAIRTEGLSVRFSSVAEDSRCPEGVDCIWEGNAKIIVRLSRTGSAPASLELNTSVEPRQADYHGYSIRLVKLSPYPKEGARIRKRDYVATLIVVGR